LLRQYKSPTLEERTADQWACNKSRCVLLTQFCHINQFTSCMHTIYWHVLSTQRKRYIVIFR